MRGRDPHDRTRLKEDLVETLVQQDRSEDNPVPEEDVKDWFGYPDQDTAEDLLEELDQDNEAPFKVNNGDVFFTDRQAALDYLDGVREYRWY